MILKKCRLIETVAAGLLFTSVQSMAVDVPVKITGTILIPPCQVNDGKMIEVEFGDVSVTDVSNERNRRKVTVPVKCSYAQGTAYVKVTGSQLGSNTNVLATNVSNFGIALYQGDGTSTKLILGDGAFNGQDSIGYPIQTGLSGKESGIFTFTAVPYRASSGDIEAGAFAASANMSISYF
ncbi:fimbrial protein [Escherichia coli]|uniref:fimbrial protein n=1 Tax=unclassified Escherichia TaxID=2608889 RepID=UPI000CF7A35D|nr:MULTISPECIES: fimbrial protein [unclassified Escherichia]EHR8245441.1 fimbrial protein [Escherichia coli]MBB2408142.1 fimbrial protein [Escherichia sp. 14.0982]MBB2416861.1 fimbrial protein [Escherichia sp. 11.1596]MBB2421210.1 fimbrial protein [Escherichia sp. 12.2610]MBB2435088.1 fimbrial protein [Escherichia sp. 11.1600]